MIKLLILKNEQFKFNDILIDIRVLRKLLISNNLKVAINVIDNNKSLVTSSNDLFASNICNSVSNIINLSLKINP